MDKDTEGRIFAIMLAVATVVVKLFGLRNHPNLNNIVDKHGSFMSKDKSKSRYWQGKPKKVAHNGHHFVLQCFASYTECNVCSKLLWGIGPQGQQCVGMSGLNLKEQWNGSTVHYIIVLVLCNFFRLSSKHSSNWRHISYSQLYL